MLRFANFAGVACVVAGLGIFIWGCSFSLTGAQDGKIIVFSGVIVLLIARLCKK